MQYEEKEDVDICVVHAKSHAIKYFPSLPRLKVPRRQWSKSIANETMLCSSKRNMAVYST